MKRKMSNEWWHAGWQDDWQASSSWGESGWSADWQDDRQASRSWSGGEAVSASASSWSGGQAFSASEGLVTEAEYREIGWDDVWRNYDARYLREESLMQELDLRNPSQVHTAARPKISVRQEKLGRAFKNYRRTTLNNLTKAKQAKMQAAQELVNPHWTDLVWTDDDMRNWLLTYLTYEAQVANREREIEARQQPDHPHHGKPLSRLMPPSVVKFWQVVLAQTHSSFFQKHFPDMSPNRLVHVPLAVRAEEAGIAFGAEDASDLQINLFNNDWDQNFEENLKAQLGATEEASAQLAQGIKAVMQAALKNGDWQTAWPLSGLPDPCMSRRFVGTAHEMGKISAHLAAMKELETKLNTRHGLAAAVSSGGEDEGDEEPAWKKKKKKKKKGGQNQNQGGGGEGAEK